MAVLLELIADWLDFAEHRPSAGHVFDGQVYVWLSEHDMAKVAFTDGRRKDAILGLKRAGFITARTVRKQLATGRWVRDSYYAINEPAVSAAIEAWEKRLQDAAAAAALDESADDGGNRLPEGYPPSVEILPEGYPPSVPEILPEGYPTLQPEGYPPLQPEGYPPSLPTLPTPSLLPTIASLTPFGREENPPTLFAVPDPKSNEAEGQSEPPESAAPARKPRKPDPLFDALVFVCEIAVDQLTKLERKAANGALKELRNAHATPEQIAERAVAFHSTWPGVRLTPYALARHWSLLGGRAPTGRSPRDSRVRASTRDKDWAGDLAKGGGAVSGWDSHARAE